MRWAQGGNEGCTVRWMLLSASAAEPVPHDHERSECGLTVGHLLVEPDVERVYRLEQPAAPQGAREAHGESVGAGAHGADEEAAVGHAVRVAAHVEESLAAQGDQRSGSSLQREQLESRDVGGREMPEA
eukprot:scaffold62305_cov59-Phaeocystis_antarctica.AAC.1